MVIQLILGIAIILVGIYIFRRNASQVHTETLGKHSGMNILRERYARGEIDTIEYRSRKGGRGMHGGFWGYNIVPSAGTSSSSNTQ